MQGGQRYSGLTAVLSFSCSFLVSFSPSKVRQISFECCPLAQEISSVVHYLPCFREWLIALLLSAFAAFPVFIYWDFGAEFSSLPHPLPLGQVQCSTLAHSPCLITVHCLFFCFVGSDQPAQGLRWFMFWGWLREPLLVCCAHLFILSIDSQACLELAAKEEVASGRNDANFSQCGMGRLSMG
jgi:hypothetical protein